YSVHKYHRERAPENLYEVVECPPNLFLTAGVTRLWQLVAGDNSTHLDENNARLCVGNSSTAPSVNDSNLLGSNTFRKLVSGSPTISRRQTTFSAEFATNEANFAWLEVGVS